MKKFSYQGESRFAIVFLLVTGLCPAISGEYDDLTVVKMHGLTITVPKVLARFSTENSMLTDHLTMLKSTAVYDTRGIEIKRFDFGPESNMSPKETVLRACTVCLESDGSVEAFRNQNISGVISKQEISKFGHMMNRHILYFGGTSHLWEIHVVGVNEHDIAGLSKMRKMIFESVKKSG